MHATTRLVFPSVPGSCGTTDDNGDLHDDILTKLQPGEPFFVLRAQDMLAPEIMQLWMDMFLREHAKVAGYTDEEKTRLQAKMDRVAETIRAMKDWPDRRLAD